MKKISWIIGIFLTGVFAFISSCDDDSGYSLGKYWISIATVEPLSENTYALILDNGKRLWPAASDVRYIPKENQRVYVNYTILSDQEGAYDHYIKVNDIWNILTKQIIELNQENADSIGNDPARINQIWVGSDYLNIDFMFNYGGIRPHAINLVKNTLEENGSDDSENIITLEFRHNSYESIESRLYRGLVCFDLRSLQTEDAGSIKIIVKVKDWSGEKTYDVMYEYDQTVAPISGVDMQIPVITSNEYY